MLRQRDSIHLMVDAASYFSDGIVAGFLDKCCPMPELRCAVTTLGASMWQPIIFESIREKFSSFDEVKAGIRPLLEQIYADYAATICSADQWAAADVWVVGWSDERQAPDGFTISMDDLADWEERGSRRPFTIDPLGPLGLNWHPHPTGEQLFEACFPIRLTESDRLIPEIDLLQIMEVQRRLTYRDKGYHLIGGYALLTSVDRAGVSQRKVHTWSEDEVGELIMPLPIDWRKWRADREVAARGNANVFPNRHQRRRLAARARG
jgi:hypothetical protein